MTNKFVKSAIRAGKLTPQATSPYDWIQWALLKGINIPERLRCFVEEQSRQDQEQSSEAHTVKETDFNTAYEAWHRQHLLGFNQYLIQKISESTGENKTFIKSCPTDCLSFSMVSLLGDCGIRHITLLLKSFKIG